MLAIGVILLVAVSSSKLLYRFGIPTLLIFMVLGMLLGSDGPGGIAFSNYEVARKICSFALVFIMFYGGFSTNWKIAKPVAVRSILMSTLGVVITAITTGLFCHLVLKTTLLEGLLIGSVIASTDAASVFAILRSRKLNLKGGLASLLEIESGSNDPVAYMLTIVTLTLMSNDTETSLGLVLLYQIVFGILVGFVLAKLSGFVLKRVNLEIDGLYPIFVTAIAIVAYAFSETIGGNGYLCVYIVGIYLGNTRFIHKRSLVHFFDGISWLMQILLFFTLGLLSFPSHLPKIALSACAIAIFILLVARPLATFLILSWFKTPIKQQLFVSWVGLRGAASIVFAIYALTYNVAIKNDIFHIVFFVSLFSVSIQGSFIPLIARKLNLVEEESPVAKTFNDYQEENSTQLVELTIQNDNPWANKSIMEADIPEEILVVMIKRKQEVVVPKGSTMMKPGDILVLSGNDLDLIPRP